MKLKESWWEGTEIAALTKVCAGDAVAAAASEQATHAVVVKDFEPSEVLSTHRPCLAHLNRPQQGLVKAAIGLERNISSGPQ